MALQIFTGITLVILSIFAQSVLLLVAIRYIQKSDNWIRKQRHFLSTVMLLMGLTFWVMLGFTIVIMVWAFAFFALDILPTFEAAIYFSVVAFTTLGFGDIVLSQEWRVLSGFIATTGLIIFSLSTTFLIESMRRLIDIDD